ncbi:hypothetical protein [Gordonia sp. VNK21]|uniref:hypothetical protein n=1 Tax=Gordonia sp. VNK21 TaxID=3382483 RepID=UPI0038D42452
MPAEFDRLDDRELPSQVAGRLAQALAGPDGARARQGRDLARSLTWEAAARAHLDFYAQHPHPS